MPEVHDITSAPKPRRISWKFVVVTVTATALAVGAVVAKKNLSNSSDENGSDPVETPAA